jgi:hypothetical protein
MHVKALSLGFPAGRALSDEASLPLRHRWPLQPYRDTALESHPAAVIPTFFSKLDSCRKTCGKSEILVSTNKFWVKFHSLW